MTPLEDRSSKHTAGPWRFSRTMRLVGRGISAPWVCQVEDQGVPRDEFEANARLIAAAPALLEALRVLFDDYKQLADSGDAGFWRLEDNDAGKQALAALRLATEPTNER